MCQRRKPPSHNRPRPGNSTTPISSRRATHGKGFSSIHRGQPEAASRARRRGFCPFGQLGRRAGGITAVSQSPASRALPPPRFPPRRATHGKGFSSVHRGQPEAASRCPPPRTLPARAIGQTCRRRKPPSHNRPPHGRLHHRDSFPVHDARKDPLRPSIEDSPKP